MIITRRVLCGPLHLSAPQSIYIRGYWSCGRGYDSRHFHNFKCGLGLEQAPPSIERTIGSYLIENYWIWLRKSTIMDLTERNAKHMIPSYCHLPVSWRSLVDRCGSFVSCKPPCLYKGYWTLWVEGELYDRRYGIFKCYKIPSLKPRKNYSQTKRKQWEHSRCDKFKVKPRIVLRSML